MGERAGVAGQGGEALDLALGLLRAPALRASLRLRPLPSGVGELLAIASGSDEAARQACRRTGHATADLVEAARFYIQQVLLADGADAYRNLGASPDAEHAVLREHHHLLMRWLHPDRSEGAQWDSALASRINHAWNQLRTPAARARYDAERPDPVPEGGAAVAIARPLSYSALQHPRPVASGPIAVACLAIACLALAWLAVTREDRPDELRDASRFQGLGVDVSERMAAPLPRILPGVDARAPAPAAAVPTPGPTAVELEPPVPPAQTVEADTGQRTSADPFAETAPAAGAPGAARPPATRTTPEAHPTATAIAAAPVPAEEQPAIATQASADPLQLFREAESAVDSAAAYLAADPGAGPLWLDLPASLEAAAIRQDLHARHAGRGRTRMTVDHPNWTLGSHAASVSARYRLDARRGTVETGALRVELVRRGDHWRVAGLHLDPAR